MDLYGLTRIEQEKKRTYGWWVRLQHQGEPHKKFFSDGQYQHEGECLAAACKWRDDKLRELQDNGKVCYNRRVDIPQSGHVGVTNEQVRHLNADYTQVVYDCWVAKLADGTTERFNIAKHGNKEALRLAIEARENSFKEVAA